MNKNALLSFIFTVIAFIIYYKIFEFVANRLPFHGVAALYAVFFVIVILFPAAVFTGKKAAAYFLDA